MGDNIFFGHGLPKVLALADAKQTGATVFGYHVNNPQRYGVVGFDGFGNVNSIVEKPNEPASNYAITGLYFVDETAPSRAREVKPSHRGELEITSLLESYLVEDTLSVEKMEEVCMVRYGYLHLLEAGNFVRTLTERQGLQVGSPDEVAYQLGWITKGQLIATSERFGKNNMASI